MSNSPQSFVCLHNAEFRLLVDTTPDALVTVTLVKDSRRLARALFLTKPQARDLAMELLEAAS